MEMFTLFKTKNPQTLSWNFEVRLRTYWDRARLSPLNIQKILCINLSKKTNELLRKAS